MLGPLWPRMSNGQNTAGILPSHHAGCATSSELASRLPGAAKASTSGGDGLWERQVAAWELLGPPLRPGSEDVAQYASSLTRWSDASGTPRGLILGVTPELAELDWPYGSDVLAADRCQVMVECVWPGFPQKGAGGICADWSDLPLADSSRDIVMGDGSFTQLEYPHGYQKVLRSIQRVLRAKGVATFRFFIKPEDRESPADVLSDLWKRHIGNFHAFKWRLAMALQTRVEEGISLGAIWNYWANALNPAELAHRLGWSPDIIATMENYRGLTTRYTFPTLAELRKVLSPHFVELHCYWPRYALGERCPILTLQRTG